MAQTLSRSPFAGNPSSKPARSWKSPHSSQTALSCKPSVFASASLFSGSGDRSPGTLPSALEGHRLCLFRKSQVSKASWSSIPPLLTFFSREPECWWITTWKHHLPLPSRFPWSEWGCSASRTSGNSRSTGNKGTTHSSFCLHSCYSGSGGSTSSHSSTPHPSLHTYPYVLEHVDFQI